MRVMKKVLQFLPAEGKERNRHRWLSVITEFQNLQQLIADLQFLRI
jgi:hypothetical protein